jgi:subtilisin family serine protease
LVLDSTDDYSQFDIDGNGFIDEDHGHGQFVQSIIERRSGAEVVLQAVENSAPRLASGRWAPMMFSDLDVLKAMDDAFLGGASYDVVNMSLGGAGCADSSSFDWGVGERLALGRAMRARAAVSNTELLFVAAAGNDGMDVMHFPAAWAGAAAMERLAIEIEKTSPDIADSVRELHRDLKGMVYAVGSTEESGDTSVYSNCGDWVNASAHGSLQVGQYPISTDSSGQITDAPGLATWSGTSFATANVSAMLAGGSSLDVVVPEAGLACPPPPP